MNPKNNTKKERWVQAKKAVISSACNLPQVQTQLDKGFWFQSVVANRDGNSKLSSRSKFYIVKQLFRSQLMSGCAACSDVVPRAWLLI